MANIAIICEGISEHYILKHIITRYSGAHTFNVIQPKLNAKEDKQKGFGGWQQVLDHCNEITLDQIFQYNDFLVIQIDTDTSYMSQYGVSSTYNDGTLKSDKRFLAEIAIRLMRDITRNKRLQYMPRIIFAICHNEIECWLLPIYYTGPQACKTNNCIYTLNQALSKKAIYTIPDKEKNNPDAQRTYKTILKNLRNQQSIEDYSKHSIGFSLFVKQLKVIPVI